MALACRIPHFEYSDLEVTEKGVSFYLSNTGRYDGAEVAQLYVGFPDSAVFRSEKELKGFRKVFLKAGEKKKVSIPFDDKTFRFFNVRTNKWETETGTYQIMAGACVADIRLSGSIDITEHRISENEFMAANVRMREVPYHGLDIPSYASGLIQNVGREEYERLLGYPIPLGEWSGEIGMNDAVCQMYYAKSSLARLIYKILTDKKDKNEAEGTPDLNLLFQYNIPFRAIAKMTGGMVSTEMIEGVLQIVNGHFFRGTGRVIGGFFRNRRENKRYENILAGKCKRS